MTTLSARAIELLRSVQRHRQAQVAKKEEAEADFLVFVRMMWPILEPKAEFKEGWIIDLLCEILMAVSFDQLKRVCINVPPGSMKSTLLNVLWPAWEWGPRNRPDLRYVSISYTDGVPTRDNLRFAQVLNHPIYQACWGDRFKLLQQGEKMVRNDRTGWKMTSGTSGSVTGFRGDRLLLDDLNNPKDVESTTVRETTQRFVREIMPSRINDLIESAIINLQQRTHEGDASGTLMTYLADDYTFVSVPAEFDPVRLWPVTLGYDEEGLPIVWRDPRSLDKRTKRELPGVIPNPRGGLMVQPGSPMAKAQGTSFWPERFPEIELEKLRRGMTPYAWDSQFNQIPGVRGGAVVRKEWWNLWRGDYPELGTIIVSLDTAVEEDEKSDFNACTVWGVFKGKEGEPQLLLCWAWRARLSLAELVDKVELTCRGVPGPKGTLVAHADYLLIEHKTRGRDVHDEICRLYANRSWTTLLVKPDKDKEARLKGVEHLFSGDYRRLPTGGMNDDGTAEMIDSWDGGVVFAPFTDWAEDVINEVAQFPYGEHDDYVDSVSQALGWVRKNGVVVRKVEWSKSELARQKYRKPHRTPYSIARV